MVCRHKFDRSELQKLDINFPFALCYPESIHYTLFVFVDLRWNFMFLFQDSFLCTFCLSAKRLSTKDSLIPVRTCLLVMTSKTLVVFYYPKNAHSLLAFVHFCFLNWILICEMSFLSHVLRVLGRFSNRCLW